MEENKEEKESEATIGHKAVIQTYKEDLEKALDTTDATVVQELLKTAREREFLEKEFITNKKQRYWYTIGAISMLIVASITTLFAVYYYNKLTVPLEKNFSVGIFQKSDPIISNSTNIRNIFNKVNTEKDFPDLKPIIIDLVSDKDNFSSLDKKQFFDFIEAKVPESFSSVIEVIKIGEVNIGTEMTPFVILSVKDPGVASKEFLLAEPTLLRFFYKALNIDLSSYKESTKKNFDSNFLYNLPVRILRNQKDDKVILFYGYVSPDTIVITTKPMVFKVIYDTIIRQV